MTGPALHAEGGANRRHLQAADDQAVGVGLPDVQHLLRMAVLLGATADDAEDAVQEVLIRIWQKPRLLERVDNPTAYVYRMLRNQVFTQHRRRRPVLAEVDVDDLDLAVADPRLDDLGYEEIILRLLSALPDRQRQVMALLIDDFSIEEISKTLGVQQSTVRSSLRHARDSLRRELGTTSSLEGEER